MSGKNRGFVFTLDSLVALALAVFAIYSIIAITSTPASFQAEYLQGYYIARDAVEALSKAQCGMGTCLEAVGREGFLENVGPEGYLSGEPVRITDRIIPGQYGYRIDVFSFETGEWRNAYDSALEPGGKRPLKSSKFEAVAKTPVSGYLVEPSGLGVVCGAENICIEPSTEYNPGEVFVGLVRVIVYI